MDLSVNLRFQSQMAHFRSVLISGMGATHKRKIQLFKENHVSFESHMFFFAEAVRVRKSWSLTSKVINRYSISGERKILCFVAKNIIVHRR